MLLHLPPLPDLVVVNARLVRVPQLHKCVLHGDVDLLVFRVEHGFGGSHELGDFGEHVAVIEARRVGVREHYVVGVGNGRVWWVPTFIRPICGSESFRPSTSILGHKNFKIYF